MLAWATSSAFHLDAESHDKSLEKLGLDISPFLASDLDQYPLHLVQRYVFSPAIVRLGGPGSSSCRRTLKAAPFLK